MTTKNEIKNKVTEITGFQVSIKDNGKFWTISNKESDKGSFGKDKAEIMAAFEVTRFDGGSFDVVK